MAGGRHGAGIIAKAARPFSGGRVVLGFDGRHPRAERWVREQSSTLIENIIADQRDGIRAYLFEGVKAGRNPRNMALDMVGRINRVTGRREGGIIGLNSQQTEAVLRARAELTNLDANYFTRKRRDRNLDAVVRKAIAEGKPLSQADIDRRIGRYTDRLLQLRAETIARTEAITALRAGTHEGFQQLIDSGSVRRDQVRIEWSATGDGRTRDTHAAMNKQSVTFGEAFTSPSGARMDYPGDTSHGAPGAETIQCRCIANYRIKRNEDIRGIGGGLGG